MQRFRKLKRFNLTPEEKATKIAHHIHPDFPVIVGISIGWGLCNLKCRMCPMFNFQFESVAWMRLETFKIILAQLPDNGDISIELTAMGEPLLHPQIKDFVQTLGHTYKRNHTLLVTNGHFLDESMVDLILAAEIDQVQISLNAYGEANYQWFTGSSHYRRVVANIENLIRLRSFHGSERPHITIHIAGIQEFADDFQQFLRQWHGKADVARVREIKDWAGITKYNGVTPMIADKITCERYPCAWLWECVEFYPSGEIYTCSFHPFFKTPSLGNIMTQNLDTIWHDNQIEALRKKHLQGRAHEIDFCANCYNWYLYPNFWDRIQKRPGRDNAYLWKLPEIS